MSTFSGVITALVTPLRDDKVDEEALRRLIDEQIAAGVDGLVPVGTTGESPTLTVEEHIRVIEVTVQAAKAAKNRVPVIAGTGSNSTRETIELSQAAKKVGADGLLLVTPYYNKPSQDHLYRHFKAVVQTVPLPTVLYNVPGRTACDLLPDTLARLCELPEIVGVKEATGSTLRASQILAKTGDRLALLSGDDATAFPLFALGGRGVISVVSNVAPREFSAMWDAAAAGDWKKARELHYKTLPLSEGLFVEANPVPVKAALAMMGRIADELRPPLYPLAEQHREKLRGILRELRLV
jgi:4-hydroxy-tetrahydrodipicolinate synthase